MNLTDEQKKQVASWIADGMDLSTLQNKLEEDFSLRMTFMEVRFLVDDLEIDLPQEEESQSENSEEEAVSANATLVNEVSVEISKVTRPGAALSGTVTFTDGEEVEWQLDTMGRLGLIPKEEGYQPPEEDLPVFQDKLREAVSQSGMM